MERAVRLSLDTGGTVKFDLKALDEGLHHALCGTSNRLTLKNFKRAWQLLCGREQPPPLVASTLLVPGYVDSVEVSNIAEFIASVDPGIPYALLAFHPQHLMGDLPPTRRTQADECMAAAREHLDRIKIGNQHLLW